MHSLQLLAQWFYAFLFSAHSMADERWATLQRVVDLLHIKFFRQQTLNSIKQASIFLTIYTRFKIIYSNLLPETLISVELTCRSCCYCCGFSCCWSFAGCGLFLSCKIIQPKVTFLILPSYTICTLTHLLTSLLVH